MADGGCPVIPPPPVCVFQMFDWILHNKGLFLAGYTEIGNNHPHAMELQTQHNHFAMNCMVRRAGQRSSAHSEYRLGERSYSYCTLESTSGESLRAVSEQVLANVTKDSALRGVCCTSIPSPHPQLFPQFRPISPLCLLLLLLLQNVYVNINRIMSVGNRLLESGHYASQQIKQISGQLEKEWKAFAAALDERSTLLEMSATFHQKCDQVRGESLPTQPGFRSRNLSRLHSLLHKKRVEMLLRNVVNVMKPN